MTRNETFPARGFRLLTLCLLSFAYCVPSLAAEGDTAAEIRFKKTQLDAKFRAEGVAVGDFNKDGKLDIAAGTVWYEAPKWTPHAVVNPPNEYDPKGYSDCFNCWADDFNGDGWTDLLQVSWPGKAAVWFENPKNNTDAWKKHIATPVASNESPQYQDVDGDGKRELIIGFAAKNPDGPDRRLGIARPSKDPYAPWEIQAISKAAAPNTQRYAHGLGIGDVNKDGRNDIVVPQGWWECPADKSAEEWTFHNASFGPACADMHVYDFDGDGDNDVLSSSAHNFGVWWHEQLAEGKWKTHEIDKEYSQTHALVLADINGDKLPDFVTGKRWWAHGGRDPGGDQPAVFYWYELKRNEGRPEWTRHQFDHDSGPGTQFQVADVNGDGLLDVITSSKKGVHYFQQVRN